MVGGNGEPIFCPKCSAIVQPADKVCSNCGAAIGAVSRTLTSGFTSDLAEKNWHRLAPGNVFANRYTIIEEIGHGGMGRIYKLTPEQKEWKKEGTIGVAGNRGEKKQCG